MSATITASAPRIRLASKARDAHPNHHLVNNNGTWWCQLTFHVGPVSKRHRFSLRTADLETARRKRDRLFARLAPGPTHPSRASDSACGRRQPVPPAARRSS